MTSGYEAPHIVGYCSKYAMTYYSKFTIAPGAFDHCDCKKVPLILFSISNFKDPTNVVGHAVLHKNPDGITAECFLTGSGARRILSTLGIGRVCLNSMATKVNQIVDENGFKRITGGDINAVFIDPAGTVPNHGDVCVWQDGNKLYRVKGFNSLVFDEEGLKRLETVVTELDEIIAFYEGLYLSSNLKIDRKTLEALQLFKSVLLELEVLE